MVGGGRVIRVTWEWRSRPTSLLHPFAYPFLRCLLLLSTITYIARRCGAINHFHRATLGSATEVGRQTGCPLSDLCGIRLYYSSFVRISLRIYFPIQMRFAQRALACHSLLLHYYDGNKMIMLLHNEGFIMKPSLEGFIMNSGINAFYTTRSSITLEISKIRRWKLPDFDLQVIITLFVLRKIIPYSKLVSFRIRISISYWNNHMKMFSDMCYYRTFLHVRLIRKTFSRETINNFACTKNLYDISHTLFPSEFMWVRIIWSLNLNHFRATIGVSYLVVYLERAHASAVVGSYIGV